MFLLHETRVQTRSLYYRYCCRVYQGHHSVSDIGASEYVLKGSRAISSFFIGSKISDVSTSRCLVTKNSINYHSQVYLNNFGSFLYISSKVYLGVNSSMNYEYCVGRWASPVEYLYIKHFATWSSLDLSYFICHLTNKVV